VLFDKGNITILLVSIIIFRFWGLYSHWVSCSCWVCGRIQCCPNSCTYSLLFRPNEMRCKCLFACFLKDYHFLSFVEEFFLLMRTLYILELFSSSFWVSVWNKLFSLVNWTRNITKSYFVHLLSHIFLHPLGCIHLDLFFASVYEVGLAESCIFSRLMATNS
jgi:hypothetical protein